MNKRLTRLCHDRPMRSGGRVDVVAKLARRAVSAALLLLALSSANAHAVTNVCRQLEAQLTALSSNAGSGQAGRYDGTKNPCLSGREAPAKRCPVHRAHGGSFAFAGVGGLFSIHG